MKIDIQKLADELAADPSITDYDFWRALKLIDHEVFELDRQRLPIPMRILQQRGILRRARQKRRGRLPR